MLYFYEYEGYNDYLFSSMTTASLSQMKVLWNNVNDSFVSESEVAYFINSKYCKAKMLQAGIITGVIVLCENRSKL